MTEKILEKNLQGLNSQGQVEKQIASLTEGGMQAESPLHLPILAENTSMAEGRKCLPDSSIPKTVILAQEQILLFILHTSTVDALQV